MIELIPTKLPHYPLPVLPALILLLIGGVAVLAKPADGNAKWRYYLGISLRYLGIAVGLMLAVVVIWGAMTFGSETSRQALGFAFLVWAPRRWQHGLAIYGFAKPCGVPFLA